MTGSSVAQQIMVGVDTHKDVHVAAAIDVHGRLLGHRSVATTEKGCSALHQWALSFAPRVRYGVEGTGSYGAGVARFLQAQGSSVVAIRGPNRKLRRDRGKSNTIDAEAAARAVLAGTLRVARRSAVQARTQTINQMYAVVVGMARLRSTTTALKWPRVGVVARLTYSGPTLRIGGPPPDSVLA
jgi:transposase